MSMMSAWVNKTTKTMKVNPNKALNEKIINSKLEKVNNIILHIDTITDMKMGKVHELITHYETNSGIFHDGDSKINPKCSYTPECPICLAHQNRLNYESDVYDYIRDVLGVREKMQETDFWKTYQRFFLKLKDSAILIKVLHINSQVALDEDILKTEILKLTPGLYKKFLEMFKVNESLFESGEIVNKIIKLTTNGLSKADIRYNGMFVDHEPNKRILELLPDWKKQDLQNFEIDSLKPKNSVEEINDELGNIKMYNNFEELVDDINTMIPFLKSGKYEAGGTPSKSTEKVSSSKSKNALSKFSAVKVEDVLPEVDKEVIPKEVSKEQSKLDMLAEAVETQETEAVETPEETNEEIFLSYESTKSFKRQEWLETFKNIIGNKDKLDIPNESEVLEIIQKAIEDPKKVKEAKDFLLKNMEEKDLLYF